MFLLSRRLLLFLLSIYLSVPALAQSGTHHTDAIILVAQQGSHAQVAITYAGLQPHKRVAQSLSTLSTASGWQISQVVIQDRTIQRASAQRSGPETEASFMLLNAQQYRDSCFWLQPYVQAFAYLNHFEILFMMPADGAFQGLYAYTHPALDVNLIDSGNPYRYRVFIKDHSLPLPTLPLTQRRPSTARPSAGHDIMTEIAMVIILAAICGLLVLLIWSLRKWFLYRAARNEEISSNTTKPRGKIEGKK